MMPSDLNDVEPTLPRRDPDKIQCANPWCNSGLTVRVRGEHCSTCRQQQERHREAMRAFRAQRQAS